jgi:hypothetical protein
MFARRKNERMAPSVWLNGEDRTQTVHSTLFFILERLKAKLPVEVVSG